MTLTLNRFIRKAESKAKHSLQRLFPEFYHKLHFKYLDRNAWGNLDEVWTEQDVRGAKEMYSSVMLPVLQEYIPHKVKILVDIGCGIGTYSEFLKQFSDRVVAIDMMEDRIQKALELHSFDDVEYHISDSRNLEFIKSGTADVVHMFAVLVHHNESMKADAVREIKRILRPEGIVILLDNFHELPDGPGVMSTSPHVHVPSRKWLEEAFDPLKIFGLRSQTSPATRRSWSFAGNLEAV